MPIPFLPILSTAASIGATAINRQWRKKEEKGRRKYERKQELDRRTYDQRMWDKVNRYNHPLQQMQRLKDAGLNPNMIYGSSPGSAVGNAQSIATGKQLQGQAPQYSTGNPIDTFMNTNVQSAQTSNLNADARKKNMETYKLGIESGISEKNLQFLRDTFDSRVGSTVLDYELKSIERDVAKGTKTARIQSQISMAEKNKLGAALLNKDLELASQGYVKGNYLGTIMKGVFGLDLSKPTDRKTAQVIVGAVLGSQVASSLTQSLRSAMQAFTKKQNR